MSSSPAPLPRWVSDHPSRISATLWWASWVLALLTAAAAGAFPTWEARRFVLFYLAPFVPAVPLWGRERLRELGRYSRAALALDLGVFVLAAVRAVTGLLPFSGHMLFLTYVLLTVPSRGYRLFALVLWLETTYFKLILWDDPHSWTAGLGFGFALGVLYRLRA